MRNPRSTRRRGGVAVVLGVALVAAAGRPGTAAATAVTTQGGAIGPAAALSHALSGGNGVFIGSAIPVNLKRAGYTQLEYAASGTATSYTAAGPLSADGIWSFQPDAGAPYRTRVLVRRPAIGVVLREGVQGRDHRGSG